MRAADQLVTLKAADGDESIIAIDDGAFKVGCGDQPLFGIKGSFPLGNRLIIAHGWFRFIVRPRKSCWAFGLARLYIGLQSVFLNEGCGIWHGQLGWSIAI